MKINNTDHRKESQIVYIIIVLFHLYHLHFSFSILFQIPTVNPEYAAKSAIKKLPERNRGVFVFSFCGCRPNERIATALVLEGNLGLRVSDVLMLRLCDIVRDGDRFRLEITEQKTGKRRVFSVPLVIQQYIENYCLRNGIKQNDLIFPITERAIQKQLAIVCDYLGFDGISTHSFRKWYATEIYKNNGYDIALVQRLLQHSSASTTQRYIGIEPQRIEKAIEGHAQLM